MADNTPSCAPPDAFWQLDRDLAELLWNRGDGATVSTRLAEPLANLFNAPVGQAKAVLHGALAVGAGVAASKRTHPIIAIAIGFAVYGFLERDRCA